MRYTLLFHPLSQEEYLDSYLWYEEQQPGLGSRFEYEVEELLIKISNTPELYGYSKRPYREAQLRSFPFTIIFKFNKIKHQVYISAIYHTSRNPEHRSR